MSLQISAQELGDILAQVDLSGFTHYLRGEPKRYVVAFTSNRERTLETLAAQVKYYSSYYDIITLGGRTDPEGSVMIDVGTATDNLYLAMNLGEEYTQHSIRDSRNEEDFKLIQYV